MTSKRASADPSKEAHGLYMVEKYERVIEYLYPIAQTIPRKHGTFRELLIRQLFLVAEHLNDAIKANQLSRCYVLDGSLGQLRLLLRFMVHHKRKLITEHQLETAQALVGEVGAMLGSWIKRLQEQKKGGKLDRFIAAQGIGSFVRYMDDAAIIVPSKAQGLELKEEICAFVASEMHQRIGKWSLGPVECGITFCGFRIRRKFKLVKRQSMIRQRRRLKLLLKHEDYEGWKCSQIAWIGHLRHGDGQNGLVSLGLAAPC